jgi:hypothetical protein
MTRTPSQTPRAIPKVLSQYARNVLATIAASPMAVEEINPGLKDRLQERGLVEIALLPHPHRSKRAPHLRLTPAGKAEVDKLLHARSL